MFAPPTGIPEVSWLSWPANARKCILDQQGELRAQQEEIEQLRGKLTALGSELASLREQISRSCSNALGASLTQRVSTRSQIITVTAALQMPAALSTFRVQW